MAETKRVVLTGGSGFIGSEVARILSDKGYALRNLDLKPPREDQTKPDWRPVDVRDAPAVAAAMAEFAPHHVVHLASDIDVNIKTLPEFKTTIEGTRNVIAAAERLRTFERFVHVSTQYVVRPGVLPKSETEMVPYTVYGEAKAETEKIVRASGLPDWIIVRPTIIWGPHHPSFADQIWRRIAEGSYRHPASRKPLLRGYGFVVNTAEQLVALMEADRSQLTHGVYYLGDGMLDYDLWADAFSQRLLGRPAKRIPSTGLFGLGLVGSTMRLLGLRAPYDMGRYFRMTTPAPIDFTPTLALAGPPRVSFEHGVDLSVAWLKSIDMARFGRISAD